MCNIPGHNSVTRRNSCWPCCVWDLSIQDAVKYWMILGWPHNFLSILISLIILFFASSSAANSLWK